MQHEMFSCRPIKFWCKNYSTFIKQLSKVFSKYQNKMFEFFSGLLFLGKLYQKVNLENVMLT